MTRSKLNDADVIRCYLYTFSMFCLGGVVVTDSPPTSEVVQTPDRIWESWSLLTDDRQFTVQNLDQLYILISSAYKTTRGDMSSTVLKAT